MFGNSEEKIDSEIVYLNKSLKKKKQVLKILRIQDSILKLVKNKDLINLKK